ncbi:hypothetical protein HYV72_00915 [Candidatus Uhrbacteria bacterium]|nr:hypothetical protein [Candidatus Uhrbacteria bacterium]
MLDVALKRTIVAIAVCSLLIWVLAGAIILFVSPHEFGEATPLLLSALLWLAISGTATVLGVLLRLSFHTDVIAVRLLNTSLRQGIWFGSLFVGALWLSRFSYLTFLTTMLLIAFFAFLELFFLSRRPSA